MPAIALPRTPVPRAPARTYYLFIAPALVVVGAVIVFPWLFTLWMSALDWKIGSEAHFVGFDNYVALARNQRFADEIKGARPDRQRVSIPAADRGARGKARTGSVQSNLKDRRHEK